MSLSAKNILRKARSLIQNRWTKDSLIEEGRGHNRYCAVGACMRAAQIQTAGYICPTDGYGDIDQFNDWEHNDQVQQAVSALVNFIPDGFGSVEDFNDSPDTRKKDVLKVFDKAINSL